MNLNLTADFLIRVFGKGNFQITSMGPHPVGEDRGGKIGTRYAIQLGERSFDKTYSGDWQQREDAFRREIFQWATS